MEEADVVVLFAVDGTALDASLSSAAASAAGDRLFWIAYPKRTSGVRTDLDRDRLAARVQQATDLRAVSQVAIELTWSALRFRSAGRYR